MIVVLCANPALDVTYRIDRLTPGAVHRTGEGTTRAGGKGTNVARVLQQLGHRATLIAPLGGRSGEVFVDLVTDDVQVVPVQAATRSSVTLVDDLGATVVNETGTALQDDEWERVLDEVDRSVRPGDVVVLAGSLPPGVPIDAYGRLVTALPHATVVVDSSGAALRAALPARPSVVAPNVDEVRDATGRPGLPASDAARFLRQLGAQVAVVSDGPAGLCASVGDDLWQVVPPRVVHGNPTGAGDALTAALAAGLHDGHAWPRMLQDAVATSAAAVASPGAGEVDESLLRELRGLPQTVRTDMGAPR